MKVFKDGKESKNKTEITPGSYAEMVKKRRETLPEIEEKVGEFFEDYDGGLLLAMKVGEDENGDPEKIVSVMTGVSTIEAQMYLIDNLETTKQKLIDNLINSVKGNPEAMMHMLSSRLEQLVDKEKKEK